MEIIELQQELFKLIKLKTPANISHVDEVADLLNISNDSTYRRICGEKPLSLKEIRILCTKYKISVDKLLHLHSDSIVFSGSNIDMEHFDMEYYLNDLIRNMQQILLADSKQIYYEAKDLPLFYYFFYPELAAFKYFFWMKTILSYKEFEKMQVEDNELLGIIEKPGKEIEKLYKQIPSAEIWSMETINVYLKQIEYYVHSGVFRKTSTAELLLDQFAQVIERIREQAASGKKKPDGTNVAVDYQLYINEVAIGHNSVIVETDNVTSVFINHDVLNYMVTQDVDFCNYSKNRLFNSIKKASLISNVGERERNRFFNALLQRISDTKKRLLTA